MSEIKEDKVFGELKEWRPESGDWTWIFLLLILFGGWGLENPKISELEKKVARLEGLMSMIGGKNL